MAVTTLVVPACILLLTYAGTRYLVVGVVREAEASVESFALDVEGAVAHELAGLRRLADDVAKRGVLSAEAPLEADGAILARLGAEHALSVVAVRHGADDALHAVRRDSAENLVAAPMESFAGYLRPGCPLLRPASLGVARAGLITVHGELTLIAVAPLDAAGETPDILLIGRYLTRGPMATRIDELNARQRLCYAFRALGPRPPRARTADIRRLAPVLGERCSPDPSGLWHVGRGAYETLVTLLDVHGAAAGALSIALPSAFIATARGFLDKLAMATALFGLVVLLLVVHVYRREFAAPLGKMRQAVQDMLQDRTAPHRLDWRRQDEIGDVARSLDALLDEVAADARQLSEREDQNLALLAAVPDAFCVFTVEGVLVSVTGGHPDHRRFTDTLLVGEPFVSANFTPESAEAFMATLRQALDKPAVTTLVLPKTDTQEEMHIECRMSRIDGTRILAVCRDMTAQRADKQRLADMESRLSQLQRHESQGRLVAGIAHDFNNLLAVIQTSVDRYQHGDSANSEATVELMAIAQAARHAANLIRQLQMYAGISDMTFEPVNLNALLASTRSLMRASVPHHIALEYDTAPYLPDVVADATQIVQVVSNLVINAVEAVGDQPGAIHVSTRLVRRGELDADRYASAKPLSAECYAQLSVMDTGRGISPTQIDRILEPFFSTKGEGRGLGLAIVAGILAAHDGAISVTSQLGEGSVFAVVVPVPAAEAAIPADPERGPTAGPAGRPLCLLLVDDDARIRRVTRLMLESLGCEVLEADQEREARLQLQKNIDRVDGLLLDANVRGMDGVRALRVIRQKSPGLPVFLFSGHDEAQVRRAYADLAFDGFIPKPFTRGMLLDMLVRVQSVRRTRMDEEPAAGPA
jgi:signal transduction histidine kinase/CheY-like chemotaxis protein